MPEERFDYTAAMAELEGRAAKVEDPGTSLDDIGALVTRSRKLVKDCRDYLRSARESILEEDSDN